MIKLPRLMARKLFQKRRVGHNGLHRLKKTMLAQNTPAMLASHLHPTATINLPTARRVPGQSFWYVLHVLLICKDKFTKKMRTAKGISFNYCSSEAS
jgi:hypothetical protein